MKRFITSLMVVALTAGVASAQTTYHVSPTGDDTSGDGSAGNPWQTITHGYDQAAAGDTVLLGAGTYTDNSLSFSKAVNIIGDGSGTTNWDIPSSAIAASFRYNTDASGSSSSARTTLAGLTITSNEYGHFSFGTNDVSHILFEDLVNNIGPTSGTTWLWRKSTSSNPDGVVDDLYMKNVSFTDPAGDRHTKTDSGQSQPFNLNNMTIDGGTWSGIPTQTGFATAPINFDGLTIINGFTYDNNAVPFFSNNASTTAGVVLIDGASFTGNDGTGLDLGELQDGAEVTIQNTTFAAGGTGSLTQTIALAMSGNPDEPVTLKDLVFDGGSMALVGDPDGGTDVWDFRDTFVYTNGGDMTDTDINWIVVPEPAGLMLMGGGALVLALRRRQKV